MDFFSGKKTGGQAGGEAPPSSMELFSSAKLVADAAQTCFQSGADKVDKAKVAGAAADLLGAASDYGKLEDKGYGEYIQKAETYLEQYGSTGSTPAPAADKETAPAPAPEPAKETPPAPAPAPEPAKETPPAPDAADEETPPAPEPAVKETAPEPEPAAKESRPTEPADSGAGGTAEGIFKMAEGFVKGGGGSFFG